MPDVLVVDDDETVRKLVCDVLELDGHRVVGLPDGPSALAYLRSTRPDCVVLDVMMPGMDGFEVLGRIRAEPELLDLPVALLTAAADDASVWRGWQSGASWFFTKPVDFDALLGFVHAIQPGRRRAPAPTSSPYAAMASHAPVGEAAETTVLEMVRALEAQALLFGRPQLVLTSLPGPHGLREARMARLSALADRGADVVVLGRQIPRVAGPGAPVMVPLRPDDCLQQEWVHVVCGPRLTSALAARPIGTGGRWSFLLTHEVDAVAAAARALLERLSHLRVELPALPPFTTRAHESAAG